MCTGPHRLVSRLLVLFLLAVATSAGAQTSFVAWRRQVRHVRLTAPELRQLQHRLLRRRIGGGADAQSDERFLHVETDGVEPE